MVTKHGNYIDCFAGPQDPDKPETWAAKLVLESRPRWLRHLVLCEPDEKKVDYRHALVNAQPPKTKQEPRRTVEVIAANCNEAIPSLLAAERVNGSHATFCLLDQWTFECEWSTVQALANYRTKQYKIEQFYFLANA